MRRLKTVRRPPIYPKTPGHLPCSSLTHPLPLSSRRPSVSFGGFGFKYQRTVARDNTVKLGEHTLQLLPGSDRYSYARARVELQERLDGSLVVLYQGMVIATTDAPPHPVTLRARKGTRGQPEDNSNNNLVDSLSPNGAQAVHEAPSHQADIQPGYHKPPPSHPWRKPVVTKSLNR